MQPALRSLELDRRVVQVLVAGSIALAAWRVVPPPFELPEAPPPAPTYRYVALLGEPLAHAVDEADGEITMDGLEEPGELARGGCLPFLAPMVERPNWQLQFVSAASGCLGETIHERYVVAADGGVTWHRSNMPARRLVLVPDELARIRALDRKDCVRKEEVGYGEAFYRVSVAGIEDAAGGAHVSRSSEMAGELDLIFEAAKERYRAARLAELGITELRLRARNSFDTSPLYRVDLVGSQLTIRHGRRVLVDKVLEPADLVETIDRLEEPRDDVPSARGWLRSRGVTRAVALPTTTFGDFWDPLLRAVDEAAYLEDPTR